MAFRKLPARYAHFMLPLVISVFMSCIVSGVATLHSTGMSPDFVHTWMGAWGLSWVIAFPTLLTVLPVARRVVGLLVETASP